jgi:hypothetical protein
MHEDTQSAVLPQDVATRAEVPESIDALKAAQGYNWCAPPPTASGRVGVGLL